MLLLPNVIIAGAPRCGSTSLFEWLSSHPEVCGSTVKETRYLMDEEYPLSDKKFNYHTHGIEGYACFFTQCKGPHIKVYLEATPDYLYQQTALDVLSSLPNPPLLLFLLRKPSARVYSFYRYAMNNIGKLDKSISFSEFLNLLENDQPGILTNRPLLRNSIRHSEYVVWLKPWLERFGKENILCLLFEDMRDNTNAFMQRLSQKLRIDAVFFNSFDFKTRNESVTIRSQLVHRLARGTKGIISKLGIKHPLAVIYKKFNINEQKHILTSQDRTALAKLDDHFKQYNRQLAGLFDLDLSSWDNK